MSAELPKPRLYYGWVIVAVAFVTMSLVSPVGTTVQLFYQALKAEFHWSHAGISGVFGVHQLVNGFSSPFVGFLLDRHGPRRVMPIGAFVIALALLLSSRTNALWQLYLTFGVIAALGVAMLQSIPNTTVIANWFTARRGTAVGLALAGSGVGQLILTPATQWMIVHHGWRAAFVAMAPLVCVVPATLVLLFVYHRPSDRGLQPDDDATTNGRKKGEVIILDRGWAETEWTLGRAIRRYRFWAMALMTLVFSLAFFLVNSQLFVLTQELESLQAQSILVATVIGVGGLQKGLAKFLGGMLSDRTGREATMTLSAVLIVAGIFLLAFLPESPSIWLLFAATALYGIGYGASLPTMIAAYSDLFQGRKLGSIMGTLTFMGLIGAALGTGLGGKLRDVTGGYQTNFVISIVGFAASVILMWTARPGGIRTVRRLHDAIPGVSSEINA